MRREVDPFPQALVDPNQWYDVLSGWIYPPLQHVDIRWFPSVDDPERGIVAIDVPDQPSARRPFLVIRIIDEQGKRVEVVFGYVERRRAHAVPMSVQELHALVRDGLQADVFRQQYESLNQQLKRLQGILETLLAERTREAQQRLRPKASELLMERIERALEEGGFRHKPLFILAAGPIEPVEIPTLFASRQADIVRWLEHPSALRRYGFDLDTGTAARIVRGQLWRAVTPGVKSLELWQDGTLIFVAEGDTNFLAWGSYARGQDRIPLRINPLALIEVTYLFVELSRQVLAQARPHPRAVEYRLELRNMTVDGTPAGLIPGQVGTFATTFGTDIRRAPDADGRFAVRWEGAEIDAGAVAFLLVSRVYEWFGIEHDKTPYTAQRDGHLVINPDRIRAVDH